MFYQSAPWPRHDRFKKGTEATNSYIFPIQVKTLVETRNRHHTKQMFKALREHFPSRVRLDGADEAECIEYGFFLSSSVTGTGSGAAKPEVGDAIDGDASLRSSLTEPEDVNIHGAFSGTALSSAIDETHVKGRIVQLATRDN